MSPEKQRIKIAEACGIAIKEETDGWFDIWENGINKETGSSLEECISCLPDYLNDLNAMREAEQILWAKNWLARDWFIHHLSQILNPIHGYRNQAGIDLLDATAAQRAEAFLRAMNLWEEST
jgi:hypothetical protein